jgi:hypothetical protein
VPKLASSPCSEEETSHSDGDAAKKEKILVLALGKRVITDLLVVLA